MSTVVMKLHPKPFEDIKNGIKKMELRLHDEKRSKISIGDTLSFTNRKTGEILIKKVKRLHTYNSFRELLKHVGVEIVGGGDIDAIIDQIGIYYSHKQQEEYGVVGIEME